MYQGQDFVGKSSDGVTTASGASNSADLSAGVWSNMQQDRQAPNTVADRSSQTDPSTGDRSSIDKGGSLVNPLTNRQLYDRIGEQERNVTNELMSSPLQRQLTPQYHEAAQQLIRDADNLPHDRLRQDIQQGDQRIADLQARITQTDNSLLQSSSLSPELRQMIPDMLRYVDSVRFPHMPDMQENMRRLREIAPQIADTLQSRIELGNQARELDGSDLWEARRLYSMPMNARFEYANELVSSGQGQSAARYLTEMLNARPETLNYSMRGNYGDITMGDLIVRSGALRSRDFLQAFARAGGSAERVMRDYERRFPPELNTRNR